MSKVKKSKPEPVDTISLLRDAFKIQKLFDEPNGTTIFRPIVISQLFKGFK